MGEQSQSTSLALRRILNGHQPAGPAASEDIIASQSEVIQALYDEANSVHRETRTQNPYFIVGRKGSGKTAFLIGGALSSSADYVLIASEDIYTEVSRLSTNYVRTNGPLVADALVHVWEVLLFHAAMLAIVKSEKLPFTPDRQRVQHYMSAFARDPRSLSASTLLAAVAAAVTKRLLDASSGLSIRDACWSIDPGRGSLITAERHARTLLGGPGTSSVWVVVDNLEDLHKHLDELVDVVTALFRVASRSFTQPIQERMPFRTRVAFPTELLPRLSELSANPEKDLANRLVIRWTASELLAVAGNRLRIFLDLHYPTAANALGLPARHDQSDTEAATATLRALLPDTVLNRLGQTEDTVAYLLRHTQLLPRHLILILNEIIGKAVSAAGNNSVPRASVAQVIDGVHDAEMVIVPGILATYSYEYPAIAKALRRFKNQMGMVETASNLHHLFNVSGIARLNLTFGDFLEGCLAIGALGVVREADRSDRYIEADFAYTFANQVRPKEDRDCVCVHPLFVAWFFDDRSVQEMAIAGQRPVYPYGSDPQHRSHNV